MIFSLLEVLKDLLLKLKKQANMMVARSKKELGIPEGGQTVAIPIP